MKRLKFKVKKTGKIISPDIIDFYNQRVIDDASMEEITGLFGAYRFDELIKLKDELPKDTTNIQEN
jgi:hypothetical protein